MQLTNMAALSTLEDIAARDGELTNGPGSACVYADVTLRTPSVARVNDAARLLSDEGVWHRRHRPPWSGELAQIAGRWM